MIAIFTALYYVLSVMLKIPITGHITLDLGYIALTVGAVYLGAVPAMLIGSLGALLESTTLSVRGVSPGWILMNAIVGLACGFVLHRTADGSRKRFRIFSVLTVLLSMFVGVVVKTLVDCSMYDLAIAARIPSGRGVDRRFRRHAGARTSPLDRAQGQDQTEITDSQKNPGSLRDMRMPGFFSR